MEEEGWRWVGVSLVFLYLFFLYNAARGCGCWPGWRVVAPGVRTYRGFSFVFGWFGGGGEGVDGVWGKEEEGEVVIAGNLKGGRESGDFLRGAGSALGK